MEKMPICRICLVENVSMYIVADKNLHKLYEKLTDIPFVTEDRRPMLACYFCFAKLKQCSQLQRKCLEAEELIVQIMNEPNTLVDRGQLGFISGLTKTPVEIISIIDVGQIESIAVKEEIPTVCERLDDVIEPKEEHQSIGMLLRTENHSESDSKDDVIVMEFKTEEQEVLSKKRRASNMKPILKNYNGIESREWRGRGDSQDSTEGCGRLRGRLLFQESTPLEEPAQPCPVRAAPACSEITVATQQQKDNKALTKKRILALPAELQQENKKPKLAKEQNAGFLPVLPETSAKKRPRKNQLVFTSSTEVITMDEGQEVTENRPSFSAGRPTLKNFSPGPSTSSTRQEPSVYEEDLEEEILQWERSAGLNPGSDIEDEDCLDAIGGSHRRRLAGDIAVEDLSSELREVLESMDRQDDCALRESSEEELLIFDWSHDPQVFTGVREDFTGPAGPTFPTEGMSPFQIFSKIWDEDIINFIVDETNKYAAILLAKSSLPRLSRMRNWTPLTPQELWRFLGVVMLQSIVPIQFENEYWTPCLPYLKFAKFADIMPFYRFSLIKRCLHFVDNTLCARGIPSKLMKIQPIIDHLNNKFSSLYLPEQEIAIDDSLMLLKGRISFSQLIATKAAQTGINSYELCESRTGYLWQMLLYTGKKERHNVAGNVNEAEPEEASSRTVLKLVRPLLNRGHTLVMDNFCNSPLLARSLKVQKTDVIGTLRLNREFVPDSLRNKRKADMRPSEVAFSQTRDMTITVWKDANVVSLISTYHRVEADGKDKYGYFRYKPRVVVDYNLAMGGVDRKDQLLQAFPIERGRGQIWYKKLFRRLLNVSIHNTFVMFPKAGTAKMAQRQFRVLLADEIIQRFRPPKIERPLPITGGHFPARTNKRKSRCKWCALRKVDTCTVYKCEACNVNLCIIGCFREFHISQRSVK